MYVDDIIFELDNYGVERLNQAVPHRDRRILENMPTLLKSDKYITQSQANLVLKILKNNLEYLDFIGPSLNDVIKTPLWKKEFKILEVIKQVSIFQAPNKDFLIDVYFSYDSEIIKILKGLEKIAQVDKKYNEVKHIFFVLEEKTCVNIHKVLEPLNFEFSEDFLELVKKIKNIDIELTQSKFNFKNFNQEKIKEDILQNDLLILDRKIRYQYDFSPNFDKNTENNLAYKIANRKKIPVYLDPKQVTLIDILKNLLVLKRDKILFIFDEYKPLECLEQLKNLKNSLVQLNESNVGIYFRFDNKNDGKEFNKLIAENSFNKKLNTNTKIVGIANGKVPKFMIDNEWYPDATITFTNSFRNNRSVVYCNACDLIVYYTTNSPISVKTDDVM
jgi:hypothetical protein